MRSEGAAIEALLQAGAEVSMAESPGRYALREPLRDPSDLPDSERMTDRFFRTIGWSQRDAIKSVSLHAYDPRNPSVQRAIQSLQWLPEIEVVVFEGRGLDDSAVASLDEVTGLKHLHRCATSITGEGLSKLKHGERLLTLQIQAPPPEAQLLRGIGGMTNLRTLYARQTITREDIESVASLPELTRLDLSLADSAEPGTFAPLSDHQQLTWLSLTAMTFDQEEIEAIASLPNLEILWIGGAADEDLAKLASAPKLRMLGLYAPATIDGARRLSRDYPDLDVRLFRNKSGLHCFRGGHAIEEPTAPTDPWLSQ